jgi:hypothetical protein
MVAASRPGLLRSSRTRTTSAGSHRCALAVGQHLDGGFAQVGQPQPSGERFDLGVQRSETGRGGHRPTSPSGRCRSAASALDERHDDPVGWCGAGGAGSRRGPLGEPARLGRGREGGVDLVVAVDGGELDRLGHLHPHPCRAGSGRAGQPGGGAGPEREERGLARGAWCGGVVEDLRGRPGRVVRQVQPRVAGVDTRWRATSATPSRPWWAMTTSSPSTGRTPAGRSAGAGPSSAPHPARSRSSGSPPGSRPARRHTGHGRHRVQPGLLLGEHVDRGPAGLPVRRALTLSHHTRPRPAAHRSCGRRRAGSRTLGPDRPWRS